MTDAATRLDDRLAAESLDHVFVEFPDINGYPRAKQFTAERFREVWRDGIPVNMLLLVQTPRNEIPTGTGFGKEIGYGDGLLRPDPRTFTRLPWRENAARVRCSVEYEGKPVGVDTRTALRRVLAEADVDCSFGVGSELEFYLLDETETGYVPVTDDSHEWAAEMTDRVAPFADTVVEWAADYDIPVHSLEHEHGPGQLELLFDHGDPLSQADTTFDFKRLVKRAAAETGHVATFMAAPFTGESGSGYHLHVSATRDGENVFDDGTGGLSETGRQFVAGLLDHADALTAIGLPTRNGFTRLSPDGFAPYTASWGEDNRMAAIRVPNGHTRIENRIAAADANPYLLVAATLAAGIDGIERGLTPPEASDGDPTGNRPRLPRSPEQAFDALEADEVLAEKLGRSVVDAYLATRRCDLAAFDERVTDWARERYVDVS